jgi:peptide/nickel transport system permease protein
VFARYLLRRLIYMLILLVLLSITAFAIIQLPPGDIADSMIGNLEQMHGQRLTAEEKQAIRIQYDADKPLVLKYFSWVGKLLRGNLGYSYFYKLPVAEILRERVPLTILVSLLTMLVSWMIAVPIGIYSATHQYSPLDSAFTTFGFVGMATPSFLLAIILMFAFYSLFGYSTVGLFSADFMNAPWSLGKFLDLLKHLPVPLLIIGTAGTAGFIRVLRGCLLDELRKQYVVTVRTKGVAELPLLVRHPVRIAMNPMVSTIGWSLAGIVSGETIVSIVLNLPTTGPLLLDALQKQDMELAGSIIMILSLLTIVGTFVSDVLLVLVDPRIRYER